MPRRLPPLNSLRAFEAAGRTGLIKRGAEELCVTHGAISRQVQQLEDWLGVTLFEGSKHAPKLSETGRILLPALTAAFDQIESAVSQIADSEQGTLDVSCPGTFTMRWLIPRLHRFQHAYPQIEVRLNSSGTSADPIGNHVDVALRVGKAPWPAGVDVIKLFDEKFGPVHSPHISLNHPSPLLHTVSRRSAWSDWEGLTSRQIQGISSAEFEHFYFMLEAAIAGLGVAIAPWPLVVDDVLTGRLIAPHGFIQSGLGYVALKRQKTNRKADIFCQWLKTVAQEYQGSRISQAPLLLK